MTTMMADRFRALRIPSPMPTAMAPSPWDAPPKVSGSPLLWDHASSPSTPLVFGEVESPGLSDSSLRPPQWDEPTDGLTGGGVPPPGPQAQSLFSGTCPWGAAADVNRNPSSPLSPQSIPVSPSEVSVPSTESTAGSEDGRCPHRKSWKRLRAKKGSAFFVCFECGAKWRTRCSETDQKGTEGRDVI